MNQNQIKRVRKIKKRIGRKRERKGEIQKKIRRKREKKGSIKRIE